MWLPLPTVSFLFWLLMSSFSTHTWSCIIRFFSHSKLDSSLLVVLCRAIRAYDVGSYQKEETRVGGMIIMFQLLCVLCGIYGLNKPFSSKTTEKINLAYPISRTWQFSLSVLAISSSLTRTALSVGKPWWFLALCQPCCWRVHATLKLSLFVTAVIPTRTTLVTSKGALLHSKLSRERSLTFPPSSLSLKLQKYITFLSYNS